MPPRPCSVQSLQGHEGRALPPPWEGAPQAGWVGTPPHTAPTHQPLEGPSRGPASSKSSFPTAGGCRTHRTSPPPPTAQGPPCSIPPHDQPHRPLSPAVCHSCLLPLPSLRHCPGTTWVSFPVSEPGLVRAEAPDRKPRSLGTQPGPCGGAVRAGCGPEISSCPERELRNGAEAVSQTRSG